MCVNHRAAFLSVNIDFLQVGLLVAKEQLALLDVRLRSCSAVRDLAVGVSSAVQDEVGFQYDGPHEDCLV